METIGDAYMVVGGLPDYVETHADQVVAMAVGMIDVSHYVTLPDGSPIQVLYTSHKFFLQSFFYLLILPFIDNFSIHWCSATYVPASLRAIQSLPCFLTIKSQRPIYKASFDN